ncbi:MAG: hypothetical protein COB53_06850 [Elusimicrobia bacterium]|nr:MAG: hypothetical protein COB53_06850 [Elusimicrobiota bacterium]
MLNFGIDFLYQPSRALDLVNKDPRAALRASAGVYALFLVTAALFYTLKPDGFPPIPGAELNIPEHGLLFWIKVQAWSPILLAVWIAAAGWFGRLLGSGKLAIRLPAAVAAAIIPLLLIVVYNSAQMHRAIFGLCWVGLIAVMVPGFRRVSQEDWLRLTACLAGLHAAAIVLLIPFTIAVVARSPRAYHAVEFVMLFWVLGLATFSVRRILNIATARAFSAVFLSLITQILFVFSMHLLGVLPKEVLKALMAA